MKLLGVQFLEYITKKIHMSLNMPQNFNPSLIQDLDVISLFNVAPKNKLDPKIQNNVYPDWALNDR